METTADFVHLGRVTRPTSRSPIVHRRIITNIVLTALYAVISVVCVAVFGKLVLPMFLVPLPLGLVLLWESTDVLRADEQRMTRGRTG